MISFTFILHFLLQCHRFISGSGELVNNRPVDQSLTRPPNIILILADDLGYGDTSVYPFTTSLLGNMSITPELQKMANSGLKMTNFHVAAPICSPARASIMTGLFPWRLGVDFIYAQDKKNDGSEELNHEQLPLIPNIPMTFKDGGYYTAHVGKWHLGGLEKAEIESRATQLPNLNRINSNSSNDNNYKSPVKLSCSTPGLNQYGYDEYVAMSEGNGNIGNKKSDRYTTQQNDETYKKGSHYLYRNDIKLPKPKVDKWLTDVQTDEAMNIIKTQNIIGKPFFINLWYDAPHSPWESVEPFYSKFKNKLMKSSNNNARFQKYISMVANMDWNIGRLLHLLDDLNISDNTLVLFTSDNGPEINAGSGGPFQGGKRVLMEGGIRVPAIWQWKGHIKPGSTIDKFGISTDIFPTFLDAANLQLPQHIRIDGLSLLPLLVTEQNKKNILQQQGDERTMLWYSHCVGYPKFTASWAYGFKLLWNDYEGRQTKRLPPSLRIFDMYNDPTEQNDLLPLIAQHCDIFLESLRSSNSINWVDIKKLRSNENSNNKKDRIRIDLSKKQNAVILLTLVNYLHIKAHLFRYQGNEDWLLYHENKPYVSDPNCGKRSSSVDTLTWTTPLPPDFCGNGLVSGEKTNNCQCGFSNCSDGWYNKNGWSTGTLTSSLKGFTGNSLNVYNHFSNILRKTNFKPICKQIPDNDVESDKNGYASTKYNRIFSRDTKRNVYISSSACVNDIQVSWHNGLGMNAPIPLCPQSMQLLENDEKPTFDDGAMIFAINELLFPLINYSNRDTNEPHIFGAFDDSIITIGGVSYTKADNPEHWTPSVLDTQYLAYLKDQKKSMNGHKDGGFFAHVARRLHIGSSVYLIVPFLTKLGWNTLLYVIPSSTTRNNLNKSNEQSCIALHFGIGLSTKIEVNSNNDHNNKDIFIHDVKIIHSSVTRMLKKLTATYNVRNSNVPLLSIGMSISTTFESSGMKILMIINSLQQVIHRGIPIQHAVRSDYFTRILNLSEHELINATKLLSKRFRAEGQKQDLQKDKLLKRTTYFKKE
jgi:arylsulfatase A